MAPKCISVLGDLANSFVDFNNFYEDYDSMREKIDLIYKAFKNLSHGLITLEQIHVPVYRETKANADKIEIVIKEISEVDDNLR